MLNLPDSTQVSPCLLLLTGCRQSIRASRNPSGTVPTRAAHSWVLYLRGFYLNSCFVYTQFEAVDNFNQCRTGRFIIVDYDSAIKHDLIIMSTWFHKVLDVQS